MKAQKSVNVAAASEADVVKKTVTARQRTLFQVYREVVIKPLTDELGVPSILCAEVRSKLPLTAAACTSCAAGGVGLISPFMCCRRLAASWTATASAAKHVPS